MPESMNHLEAFLSDDAKRGRVWTDGDYDYRRFNDVNLQYKLHSEIVSWQIDRNQVAAMTGTATWADEPKTLTPQDALRALADGKCVQSSRFIYRLVDREICAFNPGRTPVWFPTTYFYRECHVVPDPSQPAEPEYPLAFGEAIRAAMLGNVITWRDGHMRGALFRYTEAGFEASFNSEPRSFHPIEWKPTKGEMAADWRIVPDGENGGAK